MTRLVALFACTGAAVSLLLVAAWKTSSTAGLWAVSDAVARLMPVLWPASFGLMALHAGSTTIGIILIYTILILANAVLYGVVGAVMATLIKLGRPIR